MIAVICMVAAIGLSVLLWLANGVRRIGAISTGEPIGDRSREALLLIDLQRVFWEDGPYSQSAKAEAEAVIRAEVAAARAAGHPVIALRQEWSLPATRAIARLMMKGQAVKGTPGTEMARPFADLADYVLVKRVQDGFETGKLDRLLSELGVGRLRIVGLDFNYCVLKTAVAARNRGYQVSIIQRGTLSSTSTQRSVTLLTAKSVALL